MIKCNYTLYKTYELCYNIYVQERRGTVKVETIFRYKDYEFVYLFGKEDEELQPFKTFEGIRTAYPELKEEDDVFLYTLGMGQPLPILNPDYDAEKAKEDEDYAEEPYIYVNYLTKGGEVVEGQEEPTPITKYYLEKKVFYDKEKDFTHETDMPVSSARQAYIFMHDTAKEYKTFRSKNIKTKTLGNPNIKKSLLLTKTKESLKEAQNDGTNVSSILVEVQFNYHYR